MSQQPDTNTTTTARELARELRVELRVELDRYAPSRASHIHLAINTTRINTIAATLDALADENAKLLDALTDMVSQHCTDRTGLMSDGALSANEDAIDLLLELGAIERVSERPLQYGWPNTNADVSAHS